MTFVTITLVPPTTQAQSLDRLLPVLVRIQARLEEDHSLPALARRAGLSPTHFHRIFSRAIGETPKRYVQRLRLERAAFHLLMLRSRILDIALDCGFENHETFTRAFGRHFGVSPRNYRKIGRPVARHPDEAAPPVRRSTRTEGAPEISETRVRELDALPVAFIRQVGPYEQVDETAWERLQGWSASRGWLPASFLVGIAQDAPGITPSHQLRFDAARPAPGPFRSHGEVGFQVVPRGLFGITTHVGPFRTLEQAYRAAFERLAKSRRYELIGLPCVEIYRTTRITPDFELNETDLCIPVRAF